MMKVVFITCIHLNDTLGWRLVIHNELSRRLENFPSLLIQSAEVQVILNPHLKKISPIENDGNKTNHCQLEIIS